MRIISLWMLPIWISEILYLKSSLTVIVSNISKDALSPNTSIHLTNLGLLLLIFLISNGDLITLYLIKYSIAVEIDLIQFRIY